MASPWEKRRSETGKAYAAFQEYLQLGPGRSLKECAEIHGRRPASVYTWSHRHDWNERADAYDVHELEIAAREHELQRARVRQVLMDDALLAAATLIQVRQGLLDNPCSCEAGEPCQCGAMLPIRDRDGNHVGNKPAVAPSTRQGAALHILDRCGLTVPKRVELTGAEGRDLKIRAQMELGKLSLGQLEALAGAFGLGDDDGEG